MGSLKKIINKATFGTAGAAFPLVGIDNPFDEKKKDSGNPAADALVDEQERLKKLKASTFTSGGLVGEELQSGSKNTTFGN